MKVLTFVTLLLSLFVRPVLCATVNWMTFDYPPVFINSGEYKHRGFADVHTQELKNCLSRYNHNHYDGLTFPRIIKLLSDKNSIHCLSALGGFPGEVKDAYYSSVVFTIPSSVIIIRKADIDKFPHKNGVVSFEKLLKTNLRGGKVKGGTYGVEVAEILKRYPKVMVERYSIDSKSFFKMIALGQLDYTLDYPYGFTYNVRDMKASDREKLTFLRIKENKPHIKAYALCTKSPSGKKTIEEINKCISTKEHREVLTDSILEFLPSALSNLYRKLNTQK